MRDHADLEGTAVLVAVPVDVIAVAVWRPSHKGPRPVAGPPPLALHRHALAAAGSTLLLRPGLDRRGDARRQTCLAPGSAAVTWTSSPS